MAGLKNDETICKDIRSGSVKDDCIQKVAIATSGNLLCAKIQDKNKRNYCLITVARELKDYMTCGSIEYKSYDYYTCLRGVAVETKDNSLCQTFEDPAQKESCLLQVQNAIDVAAAQK
jgi:hypothetical protein